MRKGAWFATNWIWANAGVAPCYGGGFPALTLKDEKGGLVAVLADETFDVRQLPVGAPEAATPVAQLSRFRAGWIAPATKPGDYEVFVSVGTRDGTPVLALPLPGDDGSRRYKVGRMTLR